MRFFTNLVFILVMLSASVSQGQNLDSLLQLASSTSSEKNKIEIYFAISSIKTSNQIQQTTMKTLLKH